MSVGSRFETFLNQIRLTDAQITDGQTKSDGVRRSLNLSYYGWNSESANSIYIGSWAKRTRIKPPRDVDVLFKLPKSVYDRYQQRSGNKQSQILQEVKNLLAARYPLTTIKGDGPTVLIGFGSYAVEIVPAFELDDGRYWVCITKNGGYYKQSDPNVEMTSIRESDSFSSGNTRHLIRMIKKWQGYCLVPIKSFWIKILATNFVSSWQFKGKSSMYYDWMVRDFFICLNSKANSIIFAPGTYEMIFIGDQWKSKAETACRRAEKACAYEANNQPYNACEEWQKIFGMDYPNPA